MMSNPQQEKEREKPGEREREKEIGNVYQKKRDRDLKDDYTQSKQMMVMERSIETSRYAQRPTNTLTHTQTNMKQYLKLVRILMH